MSTYFTHIIYKYRLKTVPFQIMIIMIFNDLKNKKNITKQTYSFDAFIFKNTIIK